VSTDAFLALADLLPEAALLVTADGAVLAANRAAEARLGAARGGLAGRRLADLTAEPSEEVARYLGDCAGSRQPVPGGLRLRGGGAEDACRAEGALLRPPTGGEPAQIFLRLVPRQAAAEDVSAHRQAEEALRRWEHIFRHAGWAVAVADPDDDTLVAVNTAFARMHGYRTHELVGRPLADTVAPESLADLAEHARRAREEGDRVYESVHARKDGTRFDCLTHVSAFKDASGRVLYRAATFQDITALRWAEEAARAEREQLRTTLLSIADAVVVTDARGRVQTLNRAAEALTGWPAEEAAGRPIGEVFRAVDEATGEPAGDTVGRVLREGRAVALADRTVLVARDGTRRPVDNSAGPIRGSAGEVAGAVLVFRDATERRAAERAVRESESRKAAMLEAALDAVVTIDHVGHVVEWNPAAERLFGYGRAEVLGRPMAELIIPPALREGHYRGLARCLATGEGPVLGRRLELPARRADGTEFPAELSITRIPADGPPQFTAYLRDVGERTRAEARRGARLAATQALAQAATPAEAVPGVLRAVCESLGWDVGNFWAVDRGAGVLRHVAGWHGPAVQIAEFEAETRRRTFRPGEGLPGRVWAGGTPAWIPDVTRDANFPRAAVAAKGGLHGAFGCPVAAGGETLGVLEFFSRQTREPDADLLELIATVGGQVGQFLERKRAEEALRDSERRFARFMQHLPGLAWAKDLQGRYVFVNDAAERAFRRTREELYGKTDSEIFPPATAAQFTANDRRALEGRAGVQVIEELEDEHGVLRHSLVAKFPIPGADGRPALVGGMAIDVTERERAEAALRDSEETYRRIVETANEGIWLLDADARVTFVNGRMAELLGYRPEEMLGRAKGDFLFEQDRAWAREVFERRKAGVSEQVDVRFRRKDGREVWTIMSSRPVRAADGRFRGALDMFTDVTDRRRAEDALRESEGRLADELEAMTRLHALSTRLLAADNLHTALDDVLENAIVTSGADFGNIQLYNPQIGALEIVAQRGFRQDFLDYFRTVRVDEGSCCAQAMQSGERIIIEDVNLDPAYEPHRQVAAAAGYRAVQSTPLMSHAGGILGMLSTHFRVPQRVSDRNQRLLDLYARHAADLIERMRAEEALRDADRRKDEFLATLAHELRNPLAPIRNALAILRRAGDDGDVAGQARDVMERQLRQMVRLIDDLLDVSRITRGKLELRRERVALADVMRTAVEAVRPRVDEASQELTIELPREPVELDADPTRLAQVFTNLLDNASKYTARGGRIALAARLDGAEAVATVSDTGIGIAREHLPRLFETFSQVAPALERPHGGLGIGLSLARGLVRMHGGDIAAHSAGPGRGSTFTVRLPLPAGGPTPAPPPAAEAPAGPRRRLLVVDDSRDSADSLSWMLRLAGHEVHTAYDGQEAVEAAEHFRPEAVLLDIGMPRMNGYEAARRIRQQPWGRDVFLVALTGWGQEEDKRRAREAGFDYHVTKPADPAALTKLLADLTPLSSAAPV
jgi:PAS domain S-box-containing protein